MKARVSIRGRGIKQAASATLGLCVLLASLGTSIANIALPTLATAFGAAFTQVQAVVTAYLVALTVGVLIAGWLGDRHGLRPMLITGLSLFTLAALLCAIAPGLWLLVTARALQGLGAAFLMTLGMAMMRQTAAEAQIGRAMGLLGTVSALGTALGPALGGLLIPLAGWRGIFWVQVPLAATALILALACLSAEPVTKIPQAEPMWRMFDRRLVQNLFTNLFVAAVMMATLVVGPFYLGSGLGLTTPQVGLVMTVGPLLSILSGAPSGRLVDHAGPGRVLLLGLILMMAGAFGIALLPAWLGLPGYLLAIAILTPGYQMLQSSNNTIALSDVPKDRRGTVSGLLNLSRNMGLIAGSTVMGSLFAFGSGVRDFAHAPAAAISAGMTLTFLVAGGMMAVVFWVALRRIPPACDDNDAGRSGRR